MNNIPDEFFLDITDIDSLASRNEWYDNTVKNRLERFMLDNDCLTERLILEDKENWRHLMHTIPPLQFDSTWNVRIIPPFEGAIVRFRVSRIDNPQYELSIYLDMFNRLGSIISDDKPYWELYDGEECYRYDMLDTTSLLAKIRSCLEYG